MKIDDFLACVKCGHEIRDMKCTSCGNKILKIQDHIYSTLEDNDNKLQDLSMIEYRVGLLRDNKFSGLLIDIACGALKGSEGVFLDIGCGTGYYSDAIAGCVNKDIKLIGMDIGNAFDFRKASDRYTFMRADILKHPFRKNSFDGIICFDVIEHLPDDAKLLEIMIDLLKKGGKFVIDTPNGNRLPSVVSAIFKGKKKFPFDYGRDNVLGDMTHQREYSLKDLQELFGRYNDKITFEIIPTLLGSRIVKSAVGIKNHGNFFKEFTYAWIVAGQKK